MAASAGGGLTFTEKVVAFVHLDAFAEDLGHGPGFGATLVALLGVGSTTGRVLGGVLSDRLGTFPVFLSMTSGTGILFAAWPACRSKAALALLSLLIGLTFGAYTSLSPLVCSEIWGDAAVIEVVSVVYLGDSPSRLTGGPIAGFVSDLGSGRSVTVDGTGRRASNGGLGEGILRLQNTVNMWKPVPVNH